MLLFAGPIDFPKEFAYFFIALGIFIAIIISMFLAAINSLLAFIISLIMGKRYPGEKNILFAGISSVIWFSLIILDFLLYDLNTWEYFAYLYSGNNENLIYYNQNTIFLRLFLYFVFVQTIATFIVKLIRTKKSPV